MNPNSFDNIIEELHRQSIVVIGDVILDEYVWGEVRRISPEAPVPVVEIRRRTYAPGGAANSAANIISLGGRQNLLGIVGEDSQAEHLRAALDVYGIEAEGLISSPSRLTTVKTRIIAHNQQVVRMDSESAAPLTCNEEKRLLELLDEHVPQSDACILSDYGKGVVSVRVAERLIDLARRAGKFVVVDPKGTDYCKYRGATVVKPNIHEVERVLRQDILNERDLEEAGQELVELLDGSPVLITRGADGMALCRSDKLPCHMPAVAQNVYDATGAGDTVVSTLALALAAGATLEQAVFLANAAAGIVVGKLGTATVTIDELRHTIGTLVTMPPGPTHGDTKFVPLQTSEEDRIASDIPAPDFPAGTIDRNVAVVLRTPTSAP